MNSSNRQPRVSVIICTRNRSESLRITLECLASADRRGLDAEVVVVNSAGNDDTEVVARSFGHRIPVRYLYQPILGVYGKSHALNLAIDAGGLGEIIAVLDDDISPRQDWFQRVIAICGRWPDVDIFTGDTYVIWPGENVPGWATKSSLRSWIFSAQHSGESDSPMDDGRWFSGNHFWFRSRVLSLPTRFTDIWNCEAPFQLDLAELGCRGVISKDAVAGHRIQPALLDRQFVLDRARKVGATHAWIRLVPSRTRVKQARLLSEHPVLGRLFCVGNSLRWRLLHAMSYLYPSDASSFEHRLISLERMTTYLELWRVANRLDQYSIWRRMPK